MADRPNNRGRKGRKKVCGFCVDKVEPLYVRERQDSAQTCNRYLRKTSA